MLNPSLPVSALDEVFRKLTRPKRPTLEARIRAFHHMIVDGVTTEEWQAAVMAFQKRHLVAHNLGVVDQKYLDKTGDTSAVVGRKIGIDIDEVKGLARIISTLAPRISANFQKLKEIT